MLDEAKAGWTFHDEVYSSTVLPHFHLQLSSFTVLQLLVKRDKSVQHTMACWCAADYPHVCTWTQSTALTSTRNCNSVNMYFHLITSAQQPVISVQILLNVVYRETGISVLMLLNVVY